MPTKPEDNRGAGFAWDLMQLGMAQRMASLGGFGALYLVLVLIGLGLHENEERLTLLWPAAGLLFTALWRAPRRNWPWIIAIQIAIEMGVGAVERANIFSFGEYLPFALANSLDGMVGAAVASRLIAGPQIPRIRNVMQFIVAAAIGSAASSLLGAFGTTHVLGGARYLHEMQLWWAGNWLGTLCIAPVVTGWAVRWRAREYSAPSAPMLEVALIGCALLGMTIWVFSVRSGTTLAVFDLPFVLLAVIVVAAFRLPPRWSAALAAATAVLAAYFASRGLGPFAADPSPFVRVGAAQMYLATLVLINFMLAVVLVEKRNAFVALSTSDERYRNFVEQSSEAVWRIELSKPMDSNLPLNEQVAWLNAHAHVAESNRTYLQLNRRLGVETDSRVWRADAPWSAIFLDHLEQASHQGYSMDGLQFNVPGESGAATFITGFRGVMAAGKLVRVWGVARDISELVELNDQLREKQERLRSYARELVGAEERARRATAVDLHDGIGQQLVGLSMTLQAVAGRSPPEIRLLLSEATHTVREVQAMAQRVIADLSPPGLYELGLEPALKWLSVYMRSKDNLQVDLHVDVDDAVIDLDLRVLVFKIIRELLRNVIKHSGVTAANVSVTQKAQELRVTVEDAGVGFEWQLSLFEGLGNGYGLWSVADRVRSAAGEISVDTGPGRGCRVSVAFPVDAVVARVGHGRS
jgi:signal transduction histidine kinase